MYSHEVTIHLELVGLFCNVDDDRNIDSTELNELGETIQKTLKRRALQHLGDNGFFIHENEIQEIRFN